MPNVPWCEIRMTRALQVGQHRSFENERKRMNESVTEKGGERARGGGSRRFCGRTASV